MQLILYRSASYSSSPYGMYASQSPSHFLKHEASFHTDLLGSPLIHETPDIEVLLAEVAIQLYSGDTYLFYETLKAMTTVKRDTKVCKLAAEMEVKIKTYIPHMSSGKSVCGTHVAS